MVKKISAVFLALMIGATSIFAQDAQLRSVPSGQKMKIKGVVVAKDDANTFVVRDSTGVDTRVVVSPNASVKSNGGFFGGGTRYTGTTIVRGLNLTVEGNGDSSGSLAATKVRFDKDNLEVAQSIDARVTPAEERLTVAEQNAQRVSGQIDELMAISNAARGGAKAAQDTADAAVAGVNATNARIGALDEYVVQSTATVNFKVGSAVLSPEAKASLTRLLMQPARLRVIRSKLPVLHRQTVARR